ncbi:SIMPL domain-containing protein [Candidatus Nomurabacteria bacterium]|nr:SIMPL domain-containing protein [Candidatus Kaiserbacteria bacterium]MCB9814384.1 SIMPL domain-containing protein [Candidatus Nomurabacteria bacterium]
MEGGFFNTIQMRILGALTLLMVIIALGSYASLNFKQAEFVDPMPATISVTGKGEVLAVPDIGRFSFSVNADGETAKVAKEQSGTKMNDIITYLKAQGIDEKDIKTQNYSLNPKYRYEERVCGFNSYCPPGERVEDGFSVNQTVSVKVRDIDKAGEIISGVGDKGATNIDSLEFTVDDVDAVKAESLAEAIKDAQTKAKVLAGDLGVRVVRLVSYYEETGPVYAQYAESKVMAMDSAGGEFSGPELPVGEQSVTAQVNVTFEVR